MNRITIVLPLVAAAAGASSSRGYDRAPHCAAHKALLQFLLPSRSPSCTALLALECSTCTGLRHATAGATFT